MNRALSFLKGNPLIGFGLSVLAVLIVWFAVANWLDDLTAWLPWSDESRLERQTNRADTAESNASARTLEVEGERAQADRVETVHRQIVEVHTITTEAVSQARSAPDANEPLADPDADSLLGHQRGLCIARPSVCPAAPAGPAVDRSPAL